MGKSYANLSVDYVEKQIQAILKTFGIIQYVGTWVPFPAPVSVTRVRFYELCFYFRT